jgi:hypothetical protein
MSKLENREEVFSPLFLDYLQLWIPIPYEIFSHDLMLNMAEAFCGTDDGYYPPKSVRMDTKRDQIYINHASRGIHIKVLTGGATVQLSGQFFKQLTVKRQLTEVREFVRTFYLLIENRKATLVKQIEQLNQNTDLVPWSESQWYQETKVSILHLAKNVYAVPKSRAPDKNVFDESRANEPDWYLEDMEFRCRSNMQYTFNHYQYDTTVSQALLEMKMNNRFKEEENDRQFRVYNRDDEKGWRAVVMGKRGRETIEMLIYDKRYDNNNRHDFLKFNRVDFYRWEYHIGRTKIRQAGIEDLAYLDIKNIVNLWNICLNQYYPTWGVPKGTVIAKKETVFADIRPNKDWDSLPTIFGHLKKLPLEKLEVCHEAIEIIKNRDRLLDGNGDNAIYVKQLKKLIAKFDVVDLGEVA